MSLFGTSVSLMIGPVIPIPAPASLIEAVQAIEISCGGDASGFQITLNVEPGNASFLSSALTTLLLKPFNRVIVSVTVNGNSTVLVDGIITHQQLIPSSGTKGSTLVLTGSDLTALMNLHDVSQEHPAQSPEMIVELLLLEYAAYGIVPLVIPTDLFFPPLPIDRVPIQNATDLTYIRSLAAIVGYVFYITPGPVPLVNKAYWGPPIRLGIPQPALSVNMGSGTNVTSMAFSYDALAPTIVQGVSPDFLSDAELPVAGLVSLRLPPLAALPALLVNMPFTRKTLLRQPVPSELQSEDMAESIVSRSTDDVVTATGDLDTFRYGHVLTPRGLVGMRGAGYGYDGLYYVKNVSHRIRRGEYTQQFTLTREGLGSTVPEVLT